MRFSNFDVYPKTLQEFRQRTLTGALVSICCAILIVVLTTIEVGDYIQVQTKDHLFVDTSRGEQLRINLNITFPALPCSVLSLDTLDVSGNHAPNIMMHIRKLRLDAHGGYLPDEGADGPPPPMMARAASRRLLATGDKKQADDEDEGGIPGELPPTSILSSKFGKPDTLLSKLLAELLPNIFEDKEAVAELRRHIGEGCHIDGHVIVNKVAGNFHFALYKADHHVLMSVFGKRESINVSHVIHSVSFGDPYPGMLNPLDDTPKILHDGSGYFQYYLKVVPTIYESLDKKVIRTNQFSYTELFRTTKELDKLPAVYFHYELSPIMAHFIESRRPLSHFLTGLCAIVGGVFTVAGIVDSTIHRATKFFGKK